MDPHNSHHRRQIYKPNPSELASLASSSTSTASSSFNASTQASSSTGRPPQPTNHNKPLIQSANTCTRGPQLEPIPRRHLCTSQNTAARLAAHHSTIGATASSLQRPTEAQLRWAQFHSNSRARKTRAKIDQLMQMPKNVRDVVGATINDYESSDSSVSSIESDSISDKKEMEEKTICRGSPQSFVELRKAFDGNNISQLNSNTKRESKKKRKTKRQKRPKISKGRKALLRVSQRAYQQRRQQISEFHIGNNEYNEDDYNDNFSISSYSRRIVRGTNRPSVLQGDDEDVEHRLQRFEEAYIAMTTVYEHNDKEDEHTIDSTATKRWKRPQHLIAANPLNLDGRELDDEKSQSRIPSKNIVHRSNFVFSQKIDGMKHGNSLLIAGNGHFIGRRSLLENLQHSAEKKKQPSPRKRPSNNQNILIQNEYTDIEDSDVEESYKDVSKTLSYHIEQSDDIEKKIVPTAASNSEGLSHQSSNASKTVENLQSSSIMYLSAEFLKKLTTQYAGKNVIDTDAHDELYNAQMPSTLSTLLLSPTILTKRHRQAINAISNRQWNDVTYLLNANPWLAEMSDVISSQLLLHHLAYYGSDAPVELNSLLLGLFEDSVHKFDKSGNLPMHMAASSGNIIILKLLADKFKEGASVRNEEGMLPLHLAVLSQNVEVVRFLVDLFPGGLAVKDGEGNLPLHLGSLLEEEFGVDIINLLLEHDRGVKTWVEEKVDGEIVNFQEIIVQSGLVKNDSGETAVVSGIKNMCGFKIIETLLSGDGGSDAVANLDDSGNNALHLAVSGDFSDPASALAILKCVPNTVSIRNKDGLLPIELACMSKMPREVILGLLLVDLPVDLDNKESPTIIPGRGSSWWYIVCDCDDEYPHIISEVFTLCNPHQTRELCFIKGQRGGNGESIIRSATPKSRIEMRKALRFVGRYEFTNSKALYVDRRRGLKVFDALDFIESDRGKNVYLHCFSEKETYSQEIKIVQEGNLSFEFIEEVHFFITNEYGRDVGSNLPIQYCVAIEKPDLTLARIVEGMPKNHEYRQNVTKFDLYLKKVCNVLRSVAKAIKHMHEEGVIHGDIGPHSCGKCGGRWKLLNVPNSKKVGEMFEITRMGEYSPPEVIEFVTTSEGENLPQFKSTCTAEVSFDIWAFGKLCYEVFVGEVLISFDPTIETCDDLDGLYDLGAWSDTDLSDVVDLILNSGVSHDGADLVYRCLSVESEDRPTSMDEILMHPFWKNRMNKSLNSNRNRKRGDFELNEI